MSRTREYADYVRANAFGGMLHKFRNPRDRERLFPMPHSGNDYGIAVDESMSSAGSMVKK